MEGYQIRVIEKQGQKSTIKYGERVGAFFLNDHAFGVGENSSRIHKIPNRGDKVNSEFRHRFVVPARLSGCDS